MKIAQPSWHIGRAVGFLRRWEAGPWVGLSLRGPYNSSSQLHRIKMLATSQYTDMLGNDSLHHQMNAPGTRALVIIKAVFKKNSQIFMTYLSNTCLHNIF